MRVQIAAAEVAKIKADTLIIPIARRDEVPKRLPQGLSAIDRRMGGRLSDALAAGDFRAGTAERLAIYGPHDGDIVRCILLGQGKAESINADSLRELGGRVGREAGRSNVGRVALVVPPWGGLPPERTAALLAEGAILGSYKFDRYKTAGPLARARRSSE